jgi:hypothetical protein
MTLQPRGGGLSEPQYRYSGFRMGRGRFFQNTETKKSLPDYQLLVMDEIPQARGVGGGLAAETMRRIVPSKWLLIHLIAAQKTASRQGVRSQCLL